MKLKIYLFRHGQTTYNRDEKFTGFHDPSLTRKGIAEARRVARYLKNKKFPKTTLQLLHHILAF